MTDSDEDETEDSSEESGRESETESEEEYSAEDSEEEDEKTDEKETLHETKDSTFRFKRGCVIVALKPDAEDDRPFGLGRLTRDYPASTKDGDVIDIELLMPDDRADLIRSRYLPVKSKSKSKKGSGNMHILQILAGQVSCHSFDLVNDRLPKAVQSDTRKYFKKHLDDYEMRQ
jgi:hypothetical protein